MPASPVFVGFTGHRRLSNSAATSAAIRRALDEIARHTGARIVGVSSVASGADTLFAEEMAHRNAPWLLLLPLPLDDFRTDFEPDEWSRVEALLPHALSTTTAPRADRRDDAYLECGYQTVDECDVLVAVWNGEPAAGRGGTGDVVAYARARQKPVIWISEPAGDLRPERLERLSRQSTATQPPTDAVHDPATLRGRAAAEALLSSHDRRAKVLRPRAMNLGLLLILAHQLATALAIAALLWAGVSIVQSTATGLKLAILAAALVTPLFLRRAHRGWLESRLSTELVRAALQLWPLPHPQQTFAALRLPAFESLQRHLLLLRLEDRSAPQPFEAARDHYVQHRIVDQQNYFAAQSEKAHQRLARCRRAASVCTAGAIVCGASLATHFPDWGPIYPFVKLAALTLPLVTAALIGSALALDYGRRAARYRELAGFLSDARIRVESARTHASLGLAVLEVERTLVFEVWEWYSLARYSSGRH